MSFQQLKRTWNDFGRQDPLWAVLSHREKRGNRWDLQEFLATGREEIAGVLEHAKDHLPEAPRRRALDFGCGVGRLSQALADHFDEVHGVDVAPSMIEQAQELNRHGDRCRYHLNQETDLRLFADDEFDFVYSNITLQHMERSLQDGYIRELCRVLSPAGLLMFQLPGEQRSERFQDRPLLRRLAAPLHRLKRGAYLLYHRTLRGRPIMDMFGSPASRVKELVQSTGCQVLDVQQNQNAGPGWHSYLYCVRKGRAETDA